MVYYTFSQGFRPGAGNRKNSAEVKIDVDPATGLATVGPDANPTLVKQYNKPYTYPPDTLVNNEVGWKTEWLDHRLQVNGSAYNDPKGGRRKVTAVVDYHAGTWMVTAMTVGDVGTC